MSPFLIALIPLGIGAVAAVLCAFVYGFLKPEGVQGPRPGHGYEPVMHDDVAVLIACRNGEATIAGAVAAARANGVPVYVVSDASTDSTAAKARAAGAAVL